MIAIAKSVTIAFPPDVVYAAWRDPQVFVLVMDHFADVRASAEGKSHWKLKVPHLPPLEWDSFITEEKPGEYLRWKSTPESALTTEGSLRLRAAPQNQGTEVSLHLAFDPPAGPLGEAVAKMADAVPNAVTMKALRRFQALLEAGEIPTLAGNVSARKTDKHEDEQ